MSAAPKPLRVAFVHPDLGIGGAERLIVDAALGLQNLGHTVGIYTSHHDPSHCFEETKDGSLTVHHIRPPFPRSLRGKLHILFAHLRQLHLVLYLLWTGAAASYDVFFVDQLSTCIPFLRLLAGRRVVFYCHFPDKLLASGAFVEGGGGSDGGGGDAGGGDAGGAPANAQQSLSLAKRLYRLPMDWLEEATTRQADIILANSKFTARVFKTYFPSIRSDPSVVYPGINLDAYEGTYDASDPDVAAILSDRPTLISLNRFEGKKNIVLALESFARLIKTGQGLRLVLAGGYDDRLADNRQVMKHLQERATSLSLTYTITSPAPLPSSLSSSFSSSPPTQDTPLHPDVIFLLNFTTPQRTALLRSPSTLALLYTPENEHFGIVPIEAMACGVPVLACNSGGPLESVLPWSSTATMDPATTSPSTSASTSTSTSTTTSTSAEAPTGTGWLRAPDPELWASALRDITRLSGAQRRAIAAAARERARSLFGMQAMARGLDDALRRASALGPVTVTVQGHSPGVAAWFNVCILLVGFLLAYFVGSATATATK